MSNAVNLAMPFGLPDAESDMLSHYQILVEESIIEKQTDNTVRVFNTDSPELSSIHAMCRCIAVVLPAGSTTPDETTLSQPAILIKPWFWDFLQMSESSSDGLLPSKIIYRNVDINVLRNDVVEIINNERYASLSEAEKDVLIDQFIRGEVKLLLPSETRIGAGITLTTGEHSGKRSFDLQFLDYENHLIDPAEVAEVFELVGGRTVNEHPFTKYFSIAVWPNIAPIEGGIRFRIEGSNFLEGTSLIVNGILIPADSIRVTPDRNTIYATLPPSSAGNNLVSIVVQTPGLENRSYPDSLNYRNSVTDALRSATISFSVYLSELKQLIESETEAGTMNGARRIYWSNELERVMNDFNVITLRRSSNGGGGLGLPELRQLLSNTSPLLKSQLLDLKMLLAS